MSRVNQYRFSFLLIRQFARFLSYLPYPMIHLLGKGIGRSIYYLFPTLRKTALINLSHAVALHLNKEQKIKIAKESFESLAITCLEYGKFERDRHLQRRFICENPAYAQKLIDEGQGIIFFCAHQANWEALFLEGTTRMPGAAIGNELKNPFLSHWIRSIRERFGGRIISPKDAVKEGMRTLKTGKFLGLVGDQALPSGGFQSPFLGTPAWTSPLPAILSYKMKCPIIFASITRKKTRYFIHYSDPIWPNADASLSNEVDRLMRQTLSLLEESIAKHPSEWMWLHNRWKQETPDTVYYRFRHETITIIMPLDEALYDRFSPLIELFQEIYPNAFLKLFVPKNSFEGKFHGTVIEYAKESDLYSEDLNAKLVFHFTHYQKLKKYYKKQGALDVLSYSDLEKIAFENQEIVSDEPKTILIKAICRPQYFIKAEEMHFLTPSDNLNVLG
ncbi:MAG: lysophospholipid acyltransferase family protein [Simkaniaceae bacterium]|nr:lysophospholipid acyltransferase family protein [Simkaniaceae bacterium]MCF7852032.1 lysophospholipid acyltransferase family protein [Simkaniaceae bacterium]